MLHSYLALCQHCGSSQFLNSQRQKPTTEVQQRRFFFWSHYFMHNTDHNIFSTQYTELSVSFRKGREFNACSLQRSGEYSDPACWWSTHQKCHVLMRQTTNTFDKLLLCCQSLLSSHSFNVTYASLMKKVSLVSALPNVLYCRLLFPPNLKKKQMKRQLQCNMSGKDDVKGGKALNKLL